MSRQIIPLFRDAYPDITFVTHEEIDPENYYATYKMGLFFDDKDGVHQPCDFRLVGLHRTAGYILGVDPTEAPPRIALADDSPADRRALCLHRHAKHDPGQILEQSGPAGARSSKFLKEAGYRVVCIDQKPPTASGWSGTTSPTARRTRPATGRCRNARAGSSTRSSSSGSPAACPGSPGRRATPVVMISGFSHPTHRVRHALPRHQLPRLQQLLERPGAALRPQGFPVVSAAQGHAAAVRMHPPRSRSTR